MSHAWPTSKVLVGKYFYGLYFLHMYVYVNANIQENAQTKKNTNKQQKRCSPEGAWCLPNVLH